ncbi:hypothetical protein RFI_24006 [Reticulomyxa filosa]|uniref:Uncharacterized protein n=1 Tax=Reticulomyxa filosa TaxID=46433 RepID=X6MHP8_RETFI|nr:hypothetical protein RFI_24006 [Reticulomyxa filosa]|eukprot:ETO13369.1 hypothetical protein RFI_24006 [Reticulomyxa filosa]
MHLVYWIPMKQMEENKNSFYYREHKKKKKKVFLDGLFYPENNNLKTNPAVLKTRLFFNSCMISTSSQEEFEASTLLQELVTMVNFTDAKNKSKPWDAASSLGFQKALGWLGGRSWNYLFVMSAFAEEEIAFVQNFNYWMYFSSENWSATLNSTVVPLYQSLFGLSASQSINLAADVSDFADAVNSISSHDDSYTDPSQLSSYQRFTQNQSIFGTSSVLNYTNVIKFQFATSNLKPWILYLEPDVYTYHYFSNLISLIESTSPQTVQFYLFAEVILFGLNFENVL